MYIALVAQSRKPFFYVDCGVPDTLDGRFDIIVLHVFLALKNIGGHAAPDSASAESPLRGRREELLRVPMKNNQKISRLLMESLFDDMDRSLREMGVGDMGVSKRIKAMSKAAFGRIKAYTDAADDDSLRDALMRNVYRGNPVAPQAVEALVKYIRNYAA